MKKVYLVKTLPLINAKNLKSSIIIQKHQLVTTPPNYQYATNLLTGKNIGTITNSCNKVLSGKYSCSYLQLAPANHVAGDQEE